MLYLSFCYYFSVHSFCSRRAIIINFSVDNIFEHVFKQYNVRMNFPSTARIEREGEKAVIAAQFSQAKNIIQLVVDKSTTENVQ